MTRSPAKKSLEQKRAAFECRKLSDTGQFEGYASLFGAEDLGHDVVRKGAFSKSLSQRGAGGVKLLFQHDPAEPIGVWDRIQEDQNGLYVQGRLLMEVARAREVHALMKAGALDGLSIGFHTKRAHTDRKTGQRHLLEVDLWEISIVTFPMHPDARIRSVKRMGGEARMPTPREIEHSLRRDAGLSRNQARALIAGGYKTLRPLRDAGPEGWTSVLGTLEAARERIALT